MTELEKMKKVTGENDEDLLQLLMDDAESLVLAYTNRTKIPEQLKKTVRDLAVIAYHRRGTEGEKDGVRAVSPTRSMMHRNRSMTF